MDLDPEAEGFKMVFWCFFLCFLVFFCFFGVFWCFLVGLAGALAGCFAKLWAIWPLRLGYL